MGLTPVADMGDVDPDDIDYDNPPFPLTAIDRELLATKDEDYHRITWDDLKRIIGEAMSPSHCHAVAHSPSRGQHS